MIALAISVCLGAAAQEKNVEVMIMAGQGVSASNDETLGVALKLGLGVDVKLADKWSLMPEAGLRILSEGLAHFGAVGADFDDLAMADFSVSARLHLGKTAIGLGPYVSYMLNEDDYYIDWDPSHPADGKPEFKSFDYGIKPSVFFNVSRHWSFGIDTCFGLRNVMIQYPDLTGPSDAISSTFTGTRHLISLTALASFRF